MPLVSLCVRQHAMTFGLSSQVIAGKAKKDDLRDVLTMVRNTTNPQVSKNN